MRKMLVILSVVLLVVSGAGCASKGGDAENNAMNSVDVENQVEDPSQDEKTAEDTGDVSTAEDSGDGAATEADQTQKITFKKIEPKEIDADISDMEIYSTDPDLVVEKVTLTDKRDFEESTNWKVEALVKNDVNEPIYYLAYFGDENQEIPRYVEFKTLYGGESSWLKQLSINKNVYSLKNLPALCIVAHTTVMPLTSSDFTNFKEVSMFSSADYGKCPFVDVESVDLVVNDEEKGWTSAVATLSSEQDVNVKVTFTGLGVTEETIIPAGKSVQVEAPIRGNYFPDDLTGIKLSVR